GTLKLVGMEFPKVRFQVKPVARGWRADFSSKALDGYGILPRHIDLHPLEVRLKQLRLDTKVLLATESDREDSASRPASEPMLDPRSLPALDLRVDALWFGDKPFGKASLQWHRSAWGIQIKEAAIRGDNLELEAKGYWHQVGNKDHSRFQLVKGHVASLGQLQEDLGVQFGIAKAPLDITGVFYWPQAPYALELQDLSSEKLTLKMGSGVVTEVDPGVGRLVGLLSLQALGKRLSLDFSDLFSKGLEFDRIEGQFEIKNGNAYTQNLIITSPSAQILIVGRTGLAARDYDQLVTVVPRVSSTLPLVGAIAGGPAVGVALVVTQGLFGEQVDRIIQSQYKLTGSWEEPIMKRMARGNARKKQEGERSSLMPDLPSR
ncbi:MAG: AsmA-like C-terminal region-containing protein, partial [Chromatiales bacterium]